MTGPVWLSGPVADWPTADRPIAWHVRLDDAAMDPLYRSAAILPEDRHDLATRPGAALRLRRRQLTRLLLARVSAMHPDTIAFTRSPLGAPQVIEPAGWHVSIAGRGAAALIGVSRRPIGVDLEEMLDAPLPDDAMTAREREGIANAAPLDWTACWVAKEAHAKRIGIASAIDPAAIDTRVLDADRWIAETTEGRSHCHLRQAGSLLLGVAVAA
ncbi:4'-phosphopantetheinyl transferase family protein [Sphingomonas elodea]|uniref:4'-phosphopantetheinyl transferase family protein n=1 Tax=Sphingomonas elodea TaxID=179878 RepID=UPI000263058E|nr:4'-phosphopantetheinyl transferase superfamily protein [Sphingomonas elodea]